MNDLPNGRRLLLVEDDRSLNQMLEWGLAELGYAVTAVFDRRSALSASASGKFDLALLDIGLPDGDGTALAEELSEADPDLRIVLCTGGHQRETRDWRHPAVLTLLTKPLSLEGLDRLFRDTPHLT